MGSAVPVTQGGREKEGNTQGGLGKASETLRLGPKNSNMKVEPFLSAVPSAGQMIQHAHWPPLQKFNNRLITAWAGGG